MKKTLAILLVLLFGFTLFVACEGEPSQTPDGGTQSNAPTIPEQPTEATEGLVFYEDFLVGNYYVDAYYGSATVVNIPATYNGKIVARIDDDAFQGCNTITCVFIPDSVWKIGENAFDGCTALESVVFGSASFLSEIDAFAFRNCDSLANITLPNQLALISDFAFAGCTSLTAINIPVACKYINEGAFMGCTALTNVTFADLNGWLYANTNAAAQTQTPFNATDPAKNATELRKLCELKKTGSSTSSSSSSASNTISVSISQSMSNAQSSINASLNASRSTSGNSISIQQSRSISESFSQSYSQNMNEPNP